MSSYDFTFKIMLVGDDDSGKHDIAKKYCYNVFNSSERLTIGVDFHVKTIELDDRRIKMQLWNVGGDKHFRFLMPTYCLGANGAMLLYDITNSNSMDNLDDYINIIRQTAGAIPIMLIGSKLHLKYKKREIPREQEISMAKKYRLSAFAEISMQNGKYVNRVFQRLAGIIIKKGLEQVREIVQRYLNQKSKTNKQITCATTIKAIKKSLKLAEYNKSRDEDIWSFAINLSKSICIRTTPKTIFFQ